MNGNASHLANTEAMLFPMDLKEMQPGGIRAPQPAEAAERLVPGEPQVKKPSRLNELRGIVPLDVLEELRQAARPVQQTIEFPPPEERSVAADGTAKPPTENGAASPASQPEQTGARTFVPYPEPSSEPKDTAASDVSGKAAMPEPISTKTATTRSDRRETYDQLQILPSRRGQYRKKS